MLTRKQVKERRLKEGKDYIYLGDVRYVEGDRFIRNSKDISVRKIVDSHHFITGNGESWHTGMFDDFKCLHGKNMIPLEYSERGIQAAQARLQYKQVFNPDVTILHTDGRLEETGECLIRYDGNSQMYSVQNRDANEKSSDIVSAVFAVFDQYAEELIYSLQDWGESGEMPGEILLDAQCDTIVYEGVENTIVAEGRMSENSKDTVTLLKKHCSPSQQFVIVKNLRLHENEFVGETIAEEEQFCSGVEAFNAYADRTVFDEGQMVKSEAEL